MIISKNEARINKLTYYYTGLPCRNGHTARRFTSNSMCEDCKKQNTINFKRNNPNKFAEYSQKYHENNREVIASRRRDYVERKLLADPSFRKKETLAKYGLALEEYNELLRIQKNQCATCLEPFTKTPHVDHCHTSGAVRGLLCGPCNRALGLVKDSLRTLKRMAIYIEKS